MKLSSGILKFLKNKYFITSVAFIIWMGFFDPKDWGLIADRLNKLKELEKSEQVLNEQIASTRSDLTMLKTDAQSIERYAREKYLMKKDNEDIFIVKTP